MSGPNELLDDRDLPLPEHMANLAHARASGVLVASAGEARREIFFVSGEIRAARSNVEEEMLGSWLVHRQIVTEDDRSAALVARARAEAPPLGQLLVRGGCLDGQVLEQELEALAVEIIRKAAALRWADCAFEEQEGDETPQADTLPNQTTAQLILVAAREYPGEDRKRASLEPLNRVAWPSSPIDSLLDEIELTPTEAFLLSRLDGTRTLEAMPSISSLTEGTAIATLYALKTAGVVSFGKVRAQADEGPRPDLSSHRSGSGEQIWIVDEQSLTADERQERQEIRSRAEEAPHVDHYRAMKLDQGATQRAIEQAWHREQRLHSPDRSSEPHLRDLLPQLTTIVERAREAYELLSDPVARARYDPILSSVLGEQMALEEEERRRRRVSEEARAVLVEANFKRADELVDEGEPYLAIQLLEQACDLDPRPPQLLKLARLLARNPLWGNRALAALRTAIDVDPTFVEAWLELAAYWRRRKKSERERKSLERALTLAPEDTRVVEQYGALVGPKELDRVLRALRER